MTRRYPLKVKIDALNQLDEHDGDIGLVSEFSEIKASTLRAWLKDEEALRRSYRKRRQGQRDRLAAELQLEMLERGREILQQIDEAKLEKAPLNQLASALGSLVAHALKLEEVAEEIDEGQEKVVRWEFHYDGQVHEAPPWARPGPELSRALQGGGLRQALGQDRAGQNGAAAAGGAGEWTGLVAGADPLDGEPGLARSESQREEH